MPRTKKQQRQYDAHKRWLSAKPANLATQKAAELRWRTKNTESIRVRVRRKRLARFGITPEQYDERFATQKGLCAICALPESRKRRDGSPCELAVDHCHTTAEIRGLLCKDCNLVLGNAHDNSHWLRQAASYLDNHIGSIESTCTTYKDRQAQTQRSVAEGCEECDRAHDHGTTMGRHTLPEPG